MRSDDRPSLREGNQSGVKGLDFTSVDNREDSG